MLKVGFYGLDLYSLHASMEAVIEYLQEHDLQAAARAKARYDCFKHYGNDPQTYAYATQYLLHKSCEQEVYEQLNELQRQFTKNIQQQSSSVREEFIYILQNAKVVKSAEEYYRSLFSQSSAHSWKLRDCHMMETLELLANYYDRLMGRPSKLIVWAHNSHVGDARATELAKRGEHNIGQLVRQKYGGQTFLIGFSTAEGMVTAASQWGGNAERKRVRQPLPGSYEALFSSLSCREFMLDLSAEHAANLLVGPYLQRA